MSGIFAGAAAIAFAATAIVPASLSLIPQPAEAEAPMSIYGAVESDAQDFIAGSDSAANGDTREAVTYEMYVTPTPTPTPTPSQTAEAASAESSTSSESTTTQSASEASTEADSPLYSGGGTKSEWMAAAGIAESDWAYVDYIVNRESGWNPNATNASSGACGLVQALPCSKVPGNGYDPVDNLSWANGYAVGRYGSWEAAYNFWIANNWW